MLWSAEVYFKDEEECICGEGNKLFSGSSLAVIFRQIKPYENNARLIEITLIGE